MSFCSTEIADVYVISIAYVAAELFAVIHSDPSPFSFVATTNTSGPVSLKFNLCNRLACKFPEGYISFPINGNPSTQPITRLVDGGCLHQ